MDAVDILGSLLGSRSKSGGLGGQILKGILEGALKKGEGESRPSRCQHPVVPARRITASTLPIQRRMADRVSTIYCATPWAIISIAANRPIVAHRLRRHQDKPNALRHNSSIMIQPWYWSVR